MDILTLLGVISTGAAILFYHLEPRHSLWVLGFALASLSSAVYAFLQGAWPFGVAEMFWFGVALHRYSLLRRGALEVFVAGSGTPPPGGAQTPAVLAVPDMTSHCRAGYELRPITQRQEARAAMGSPGPSNAAMPASRVARVS